MVIGQLNQRISFLVPERETNEGGGVDTKYRVDIPIWASVKRKNGFRSVQSGIDGIETTVDFYARQSVVLDGVNKDFLILYRGKSYSIQDIERMNEESKFIRFRCAEREDWTYDMNSI